MVTSKHLDRGNGWPLRTVCGQVGRTRCPRKKIVRPVQTRKMPTDFVESWTVATMIIPKIKLGGLWLLHHKPCIRRVRSSTQSSCSRPITMAITYSALVRKLPCPKSASKNIRWNSWKIYRYKLTAPIIMLQKIPTTPKERTSTKARVTRKCVSSYRSA